MTTAKPRMACALKPRRPQVPHEGEIVYYLRIHETDTIKIGTTCQWERRVEGLMRQFGTLTLIATEPGYRDREREIHLMHGNDRIYPNREEFRASETLMAYIASLNGGEDSIRYEAESRAARAMWNVPVADALPPRRRP